MEGFEARLKRLEDLADGIRDRDTPLEEAMKLFDEGVALSKGLEEELKGFERKVEILTNEPDDDGGGEADLADFAED